MTDIIIRTERKRADKDHWIRPAPPTGNTEQQFWVWLGDERIGSWSDPECSAARWLVEHGKAARSDTLRTYYGEKASLTGSVGWFAGHRVDESDSHGGTPRFVKWTPMPKGLHGMNAQGQGLASDDSERE